MDAYSLIAVIDYFDSPTNLPQPFTVSYFILFKKLNVAVMFNLQCDSASNHKTIKKAQIKKKIRNENKKKQTFAYRAHFLNYPIKKAS